MKKERAAYEALFETAIGRHNIAWRAWMDSGDRLTQASMTPGANLSSYLLDYNDAQREFEHSHTDLIAARVTFKDWMRRRVY